MPIVIIFTHHCFLYEFLMGRQLDISVAVGGGYVDAIDSHKLVAASKGREVPDRRWRVRKIMEMPDHRIDRVIRSAEANQGQLSRVLAKEIPALAEEGIWEAIREAIQDAFREESPGS